MKVISTLAVALIMTTSPFAGDQPAKPAPKAPTLRLGDPAPPLHISQWLNGKDVKSFEPGKVYVVEFWALWCGPCLSSMPALASLQNEYRDKGLTIIGVSKKDDQTEKAKLEEFITKRSKRYPYTFAYCEDQVTYDAYMTATGLSGIPAAFVVGKTGKIEFIGHAMELDWVIPLVMNDKWRGQTDIDLMHKEMKRISNALNVLYSDQVQAQKDFVDFEHDYPKLMSGYFYQAHKLRILLMNRKYDDAKELAESLIQKGIDTENAVLLNSVQFYWSFPLINKGKKYPEITLRAAQAALKVEGDKDPEALFDVATAHLFVGDKVKANEFGQKAIAATAVSNRRKIEERVKALLEE